MLRVVRTVVVVGGPMAAIASVLVLSIGGAVSLRLGRHLRGDLLLGHGRLGDGDGAAVGIVPWVLLLGGDGHHEETQEEEANPEMSRPGGMMARQHGGLLTMKMQWNGVLLYHEALSVMKIAFKQLGFG